MVTLATDATLGLTNLDDEITVDELELEGELPAWLGGQPAAHRAGALGPRRADRQPLVRRPGDAASLHDRRRPRLLRQPLPAHEGVRRRQGRHGLGYREFATDPCRSAFQRVASLFDPGFTDNANVNVAKIMGKWVALTETPMAVAFDPETLATLGVSKIPATTAAWRTRTATARKALSMGVQHDRPPAPTA